MPREFDHDRLTREQLSKALHDAGLGVRAFAELTGAKPQHVKLWLKPDNDPKRVDPPFWVTSWLALYMLPHASVVASQVRDAMIYEPVDDDAADAA